MSYPLNVVFAGTPAFAVPSLQALLDSEHKVCAVYTQPDRPSGRGLKLHESPVKTLALDYQLPIFQPTSLREPAEQQILAALNADIIVVAAYGLLFPRAVLKMPKYGCINVHASLLPRWRGAAPIQYAILTGDKETGVTMMQMDIGMDTGSILNQIHCPIQPNDTADSLCERLSGLGADALLMALSNIQFGLQKPQPQDDHLVTYANKLTKQQAQLDWRLSAVELERQIRAFNAWPIAWSSLNGQIIRIWESHRVSTEQKGSPGQIIEVEKKGIQIATGEGVLYLTRLQRPGGKILSVAELLNAKNHPFISGSYFVHVP